MQELDQQQARAILKDRGTRFLDYLAAVSQTFATRTPQHIGDSQVSILSSQLPDLPNLITVGPTASGHAWLTVKQPGKPKPVHVPDELGPYLNRATIRKTTQTPKLNEAYDELRRAIQAAGERITPDIMQMRARIRHIETAFDTWRTETWTPWATRTRPYEQVYDLYQKLFDLYLFLDKESDDFELLFGHGILTWSGRRAVDYPLVLTDAHMIFKEHTGSIVIEAVAPSRMSVAPFSGTDLPGYDLLARYQDTFNDDPVDVWNAQESDALLRHIVTQLGATARIDTGLDLKPGEEPALQRGWCLLLRKRTDNTSMFYRGLARKLQESDYLPEAFDAMFSDISVVRAATGGPVDDGTARRLLMPLPANEDQKRIVDQLSRNSGVTVQGPPGTGKSHTIVNLISHLLAHGKRVLVTAEKAQALAVLQSKIPVEIRDFAVASIGESAADTETLRLSVQRMQDSLCDVDVQRARQRVTRLNETIDQADERIEAINRELISRLERQMDEFDTGDGRKSAAQTAQWVTANAAYNIIPDAVSPTAVSPLTADEYHEYISLVGELSEPDIAESALVLPDPEMLPSAVELSSLQERLDKVHASVDDLERSGLDLHAVDAASFEQVESLLRDLREMLAERRAFDGKWERELGNVLRANGQQRAWLRQGLETLQRQIDRCLDLSGQLLGHVISVPSGNPKDQHEMLVQWMERVSQGKGLPKVFNKNLRAFGESVNVDGYVPQTIEELRLVEIHIEQRRLLAGLPALMRQTFDGLPTPDIDMEHVSASSLAGIVNRISVINAWWEDRYPVAVQGLRAYFPYDDPACDIDDFGRAISILEGSIARRQEHELRERLESVASALESHTGLEDSDLWRQLLDALRNRDDEAWQRAIAEAGRLAQIRQHVARLQTLHDRLAMTVPQWANLIRLSHGDPRTCGDAHSYELIWRLAQATSWLNDIAMNSDVTALLEESRAVAKQRQDATLQSVGLSARLHLKETQDPDARKALSIWLDAMKRYGKGTGKNADNYLATARHELPKAMNAMPVWIMPLHKVMNNFNPAISQLFDVIIVDESSQCNLLSVGVLALARKAVIVGDDKQTSPTNAFKSVEKMIALQDRFIPDIPGKSLFTFDDSLYTMSNRVFQSQIMLREHFRCVPEIIDYSNRFYDRQIFPLRERSHPEIGSPLQARHVTDAEVLRFGKDIVNYTEAQAIADQIRDCCADSRYDGMTFGVVTLMSSEPHQKTISDKIVEAIGAEEYAKRHLRVGNPPAFQGDERNVMFLSCVSEAAGGRAYSATGARDAQWANVAASRAQDQLWVFYSMNPSDLNANDLRRGLIEYVRDYTAEESEDGALIAARTDFERDVVRRLDAHGFGPMTHMHHSVGRYSIDCVVTVAKGLSLAIECDGDESKTAEEFAQDIAKQRVLERLGWNFLRLSAPSYYLDAEKTMEPVYEYLEMLTEMSEEIELSEADDADAEDDSGETGGMTAPQSDETIRTETPFRELHDAMESLTVKTDSLLGAPLNAMDKDLHVLKEIMPDEETARQSASASDGTGGISDENTPNGADTAGPDSTESRRPQDFERMRSLEDEDDDSEYSVIEYAALLSRDDIPQPGEYERNSKWIRATLSMLIANEFPLSHGLLLRQLTPILEDRGLPEGEAHAQIDDSLRYLNASRQVRRIDGYYYPEPIDVPFRIIQHRDIADISVMEVGAVIRQLTLSARGKRQSAISELIDRIYGWNDPTPETVLLVDQAYRSLEHAGLVTIMGGRVLPTRASWQYGTGMFDHLAAFDERRDMVLTEEEKNHEQHGSSSEEAIWTVPPAVPVHVTAQMMNMDDDVDGDTGADNETERHIRVYTTYGERYRLKYAEPVRLKDLPLRADYTDIEEWLREIIVKLVYSEYPICYAMVRKQLGPLLEESGIPESGMDDLLHDCLAQCAGKIRKKSDGFYYPIDSRGYPFRIIRHREIGFISNQEIAFVMRRIIRSKPGNDRNWLFDETYLVYGFPQFGTKVQRAFESAYRYLIRSHAIIDHGGRLSVPSTDREA